MRRIDDRLRRGAIVASLACLIAGPAPAQVTNVYNLTTQTVTNNVGVTPYTVPVTT
ncbi:MAG: hypothetical protein IT577_05870, partial [Verrucomicrobiae bacterium]|nr:hypothetical protein [Verrucomicrobiae bacterium]